MIRAILIVLVVFQMILSQLLEKLILNSIRRCEKPSQKFNRKGDRKIMGLISKRGQEVKEIVNKDDIDLQKVFIRLKDGQSVRVRILSVFDYVQYKAHAHGFNYGIYTQPCLAPTGAECPLCKVYQYDKEEYKDLRPSNRYLVAMADLDEQMIRVWDCSKSQLKNLIAQMEEYEDMINDPDEVIAFTFKRTGTKTSTSYTLSPIMNKKTMKELDEAYHSFDDKAVEDSYFEGCLVPRSEDILMKALQQAGVEVDTIFPNYKFEDEPESSDEDDYEPIDNNDIPF